MTKTYMPKEFLKETSSPENKRSEQIARKELNATDTCPICGGVMRILSVNGHNAYTCMADRVCLPIT